MKLARRTPLPRRTGGRALVFITSAGFYQQQRMALRQIKSGRAHPYAKHQTIDEPSHLWAHRPCLGGTDPATRAPWARDYHSQIISP
jgi:hypothetical protein